MDRTRVILFASVVAAAMVFGGVIGGTALAKSSLVPAGATLTALTAASSRAGLRAPGTAFKSNETPSHEAGESASREAAENNGTFRGGPGGPGGFLNGHPCGGHSNEDATHEKSESSAVEASENAACPATAAPSPSA